MTWSRRRRGFTLLEVLIALAIFVMAAIILAASYLNVLASYEAANRGLDRNEDVEFARMALMTEAERETVEKGGEFEGVNGRRIRWKATLEETELPDLYLVLFECEISGGELKQPERVLQQFRLLRPTWSKGDERDKLRAKVRDRIAEIVAKDQTR